MDDPTLLHRIGELVEEEHRLRAKVQAGEISTDEEHARLRKLEEALDQSWDLLRRRRAAREVGVDPNIVQPRPTPEVEDYLQ